MDDAQFPLEQVPTLTSMLHDAATLSGGQAVKVLFTVKIPGSSPENMALTEALAFKDCYAMVRGYGVLLPTR